MQNPTPLTIAIIRKLWFTSMKLALKVVRPLKFRDPTLNQLLSGSEANATWVGYDATDETHSGPVWTTFYQNGSLVVYNSAQSLLNGFYSQTDRNLAEVSRSFSISREKSTGTDDSVPEAFGHLYEVEKSLFLSIGSDNNWVQFHPVENEPTETLTSLGSLENSLDRVFAF